VVITSPVEGEGKTATIANLGVVLARGGQRTVLVSCDLRRPRLGTFFNDSPHPGLLSVLLDDVALGDAVQQVQGIPNLWILDTGPLPPDPHRALADVAAQKIFEELALNFDVVLIDSPPLLPVADALVLGQIADATLMIMSVRQTRKRQLRRALEVLETAHIPLVGAIVNEVTHHSSSRYPSYDYGYGGYSYKQPDRKKAAHKKEHRGNVVLPSVSGAADENEASPVDGEETSQIGEERRTWRPLQGSAEASG
jgi:capsular exopolysaccharide synthesis family protein